MALTDDIRRLKELKAKIWEVMDKVDLDFETHEMLDKTVDQLALLIRSKER